MVSKVSLGEPGSVRAVSGHSRYRRIQRVLIIEFLLNLFNAVLKAALGIWTGSLAIVSDAGHSVVDGTTNMIGLVALRWAEAPPDELHPYGHQKFEAIAAAVVGGAVALVGLRLGWEAIEALTHDRVGPTMTATDLAGLAVTMTISVVAAVYEGRQAKQLQSEYLAADAAHTASDVLVTGLVITSVIASSLGLQWADPVGAFIVSAIIARVAWMIFSRSLAALADTAAIDATDVASVCLTVDGVRACHQIRSRGMSHCIYVDFHLQIGNDRSLQSAYETAREVESALKHAYPQIVDVMIYLEPMEKTVDSL